MALSRKATKLRPGAAKPERVANELEQDIRSGLLVFGDQLQSENELVQRFAVSRNTVRKGLEELSSRGLITTRMGIGSFVTFNGQTINAAVGWSRALSDSGVETEIRTLRVEFVHDPELAARSRLPLLPELEDVPLRGLRGGSLHETMRAAGLVPHHGEEWADLEMLSAEDAALLECKAGTAFLRARRLTRDANNRPIEYVVSLLNPDYFALHLEF